MLPTRPGAVRCSSSKRSRRHYTTEQKVAILKRHMVDKVAVSDLCNELGLQPSVFYQWLGERGGSTIERTSSSQTLAAGRARFPLRWVAAAKLGLDLLDRG
ncbi:MAG: transposase [Deltaproteobacteria bacterium]